MRSASQTGDSQDYAQNDMYMTTWALLVQLLMVLIIPCYTGSTDVKCDEDGTPVHGSFQVQVQDQELRGLGERPGEINRGGHRHAGNDRRRAPSATSLSSMRFSLSWFTCLKQSIMHIKFKQFVFNEVLTLVVYLPQAIRQAYQNQAVRQSSICDQFVLNDILTLVVYLPQAVSWFTCLKQSVTSCTPAKSSRRHHQRACGDQCDIIEWQGELCRGTSSIRLRSYEQRTLTRK